ncbi:hypothetical protein CDV31_005181 [Fusarium ambrosium]|uniref:Uncharacterized protein n=1 Tax=Fusarium ambrosium TaxID=131363 RepID=A0A428ULI8_9HYPO|nr:hypothetical protein CDV31_005181 [Fusarium ambrosium]
MEMGCYVAICQASMHGCRPPDSTLANMDTDATVSRAWVAKVEDMERKETRARPWRKIYGNSVDCVFDDVQEVVHVENKDPSGQTIEFAEYDVQANG